MLALGLDALREEAGVPERDRRDAGECLHQLAIVRVEIVRHVAVQVDHAHHVTLVEERHRKLAPHRRVADHVSRILRDIGQEDRRKG